MSGVYSAINLSLLPKPDVIEAIEPEVVLEQMRAEFSACFADDHPIQQALTLESEPINKVLEVWAYRYSLKVAEENRKARALMLAFATGGDLDHIGVTYYRLERKQLQLEDLTTIPPTEAIYESDDAYRERLALSIESQTNAGSAGSYEFHALSASPEVFNVTVDSPLPTVVDVYLAGQIKGDVLEQAGKKVGVSNNAVKIVDKILQADEVRPIGDRLNVYSAKAKAYEIDAVVYVKAGISPSLVLKQGLADLRAYLTSNFSPNARVDTSKIIGALDVTGVSRIELKKPSQDVIANVGEVAHCTNFVIVADVG